MKKYTIGEILNSFDNTSYIAYSFKGIIAEQIIICDTENENRLMWIKSNGEAGYDFYFGIPNNENEEIDNYIFYHELNEFPEMQKKIMECYLNAIKNSLLAENDEKDFQ